MGLEVQEHVDFVFAEEVFGVFVINLRLDGGSGIAALIDFYLLGVDDGLAAAPAQPKVDRVAGLAVHVPDVDALFAKFAQGDLVSTDFS